MMTTSIGQVVMVNLLLRVINSLLKKSEMGMVMQQLAIVKVFPVTELEHSRIGKLEYMLQLVQMAILCQMTHRSLVRGKIAVTQMIYTSRRPEVICVLGS